MVGGNEEFERDGLEGVDRSDFDVKNLVDNF